MSGMKKTLEIKKDKVGGAVKEKTGKMTGNRKMELKGKAQGMAASVKEKFSTIKK